MKNVEKNIRLDVMHHNNEFIKEIQNIVINNSIVELNKCDALCYNDLQNHKHLLMRTKTNTKTKKKTKKEEGKDKEGNDKDKKK